MTRILQFKSVEDVNRFPMIYEGFLNGGNLQPAAMRSGDIKRLEREVLVALRGVSTPTDETFQNTDEHHRKYAGGDVTLSQQALDLLVKYMEATPWHIWKVDTAMDTIDWILSAERR